MASKGYVYLREPMAGGIVFVSLTAEAYVYYEAQRRARQPAEELAAQVRDYVDATAIAVYPDAATRLDEAAELLWSARRDSDVTPIGFKCREAMQFFAQSYYARFYPRAADEPMPKEKTANLVYAVLAHLRQARGQRDTDFNLALYEFWQRLIGIDQKVVHGSDVAERPLTWEDGRRVVMYSYLVIGELHLLASGERTS